MPRIACCGAKRPHRLEAEACATPPGRRRGIEPCAGGPGFRGLYGSASVGHYTYLPADPIGPEYNRRSIYRTWTRGGRNGLLDAFDCPDPSTTAPRRAQTTTPLQALVLLNNSFVLRMSDALARRVEREAGTDVDRQVARTYQLAYGRDPVADELPLATGCQRARLAGTDAGNSSTATSFCMSTDSAENSYLDPGTPAERLAALASRRRSIGADSFPGPYRAWAARLWLACSRAVAMFRRARGRAKPPICRRIMRAQAQRAIHICLCGALSHVDSFDYKPALSEISRSAAPGGRKAGRVLRPGRLSCARTIGNSPSAGVAGCGSRSCFPALPRWPTS